MVVSVVGINIDNWGAESAFFLTGWVIHYWWVTSSVVDGAISVFKRLFRPKVEWLPAEPRVSDFDFYCIAFRCWRKSRKSFMTAATGAKCICLCDIHWFRLKTLLQLRPPFLGPVWLATLGVKSSLMTTMSRHMGVVAPCRKVLAS